MTPAEKIAFPCRVTDQGFCQIHQERIGYKCILAIRILESRSERLAELEARQLELVNIVKELIMELNKAYGVEA